MIGSDALRDDEQYVPGAVRRSQHLRSYAAGNEPALRLYQKAGFVLYGTDPAFQYVNGRYIDEHLMVRFFDKAPGEDQ